MRDRRGVQLGFQISEQGIPSHAITLGRILDSVNDDQKQSSGMNVDKLHQSGSN